MWGLRAQAETRELLCEMDTMAWCGESEQNEEGNSMGGHPGTICQIPSEEGSLTKAVETQTG